MFRGKFTALLIAFIFSSLGQSLFSQTVYTFQILGKKYEFIKEKKSWVDASAYALEHGGYLIHIDSKEEQKAIYDSITKKANLAFDYTVVIDGGGVAYIWIGATDKAEEGTWIWDGDNDDVGDNFWNGQGKNGEGDGKAVAGKYCNWGGTSASLPMEPDNYMNKQDAAAIALEGWPAGVGSLGIAGEWNDIDITNSLYFIVEYDAKTETPKMIKPDDKAIDLERQPIFSWTKVAGAVYTFQVSKDSSFKATPDIYKANLKDTFFHADVKLDYNTKYFWRVNAVIGKNTSDWSAIRSFNIKNLVVQKPALISPDDNFTDATHTQVFIWNKGDGETYSFQISKSSDFTSGIVVDKGNFPDTSYTLDVLLEYGMDYYWRVNAAKDGINSLWSDVRKFRLKIIAPESPELMGPDDNAENMDLSPTFSFKEIKNAEKYKLLISLKQDLTNPVYNIEFLAEPGLNSYTIKQILSEGTTYYWGMSAMNSAGESPMSSTRKFTTKGINLVNDNPFPEFTVFPNPASDFIEISIPQNDHTLKGAVEGIKIFNIFGEEVSTPSLLRNATPQEGNLRIDVSALRPGVYFVRVGTQVGKLVKM